MTWRRLVTGTIVVVGLQLLVPPASRAAMPLTNGCHVVAPSTVSCKYVAHGNGTYIGATRSPWLITVLHGQRRIAVAANPGTSNDPTARTGTFRAAPGDVVTVSLQGMVPVGTLEAADS